MPLPAGFIGYTAPSVPHRPFSRFLMNFVPHTDAAINAVRIWLEKAVIGLNLCPFAKSVYVRHRIRFAVSQAITAEALTSDLMQELAHLQSSDPAILDTTLLIHPCVLRDFDDYNQYLDVADAVLDEMGLVGELQIASFHPDYQFAGSAVDDISNYTNRSPYPILHLLRESSIEAAIGSHPDPDSIYQANIALLRRIGKAGWDALDIPTPAFGAGTAEEKP